MSTWSGTADHTETDALARYTPKDITNSKDLGKELSQIERDQSLNFVDKYNSFGHGLLFVDTRFALCSDTVAWVKGFSWYKGDAESVEVYCIKPEDLRNEAFLREVKKVVARSILEKEIGMEPVYNNLLRVSNA